MTSNDSADKNDQDDSSHSTKDIPSEHPGTETSEPVGMRKLECAVPVLARV